MFPSISMQIYLISLQTIENNLYLTFLLVRGQKNRGRGEEGKRERGGGREKEREKPWVMTGSVSGMHIIQGLSNAH